MKWVRGEVGEESGEKTGRVWRCGEWDYTKNSTKTQHIWRLGTSLGCYHPVSYMFENIFPGTTLPSEVVCLCLEPFKSNKA